MFRNSLLFKILLLCFPVLELTGTVSSFLSSLSTKLVNCEGFFA